MSAARGRTTTGQCGFCARGSAGAGNAAQLRAGTVTHVPVAGRITDRSGSVVNTVTGVVFNLTGVNGGGNGFVTAYPFGGAVPNASVLNFSANGQVVPNTTVVTLCRGCGQDISISVTGTAYVIGDVMGSAWGDSRV